MPQNDMVGFECLQPEGSVALASGLTTKTVGTWAAAVTQLWLTPRPRVIVVLGGTSFTVTGGDGLKIVKGPAVALTQERREIFRYSEDEETGPTLPKDMVWVSADHASNYAGMTDFWCQFASSWHATSRHPRPLNNNQTSCPFSYANGVETGDTLRWSADKTMLHIHIDDATHHDSRVDIPVLATGNNGLNPFLRTTGNVTATVTTEADANHPKQVKFYRDSGCNFAFWHPTEWCGMTYGWVIGDPQVVKRVLSFTPDPIIYN